MGPGSSARLLLLSVPLVALLSSVAGIRFGPLRHTGLMWMLTWGWGLAVLVLRTGGRVHFPWRFWLPFYVICGASFFWSDMSLKYNLQLFLQMTVFYLVGMVASLAVERDEDVAALVPLFLLTWVGVAAACVFFLHGPGAAFQTSEDDLYIGFATRPAAMTLIVIAAVFLAQFAQAPIRAGLVWTGCLAVAILSGSRMVTLVLLFLWLAHPRLARPRTRLAMAIVTVIAGLIAFQTPIIQERFFDKRGGFSGKGTIQDVVAGKFDSAGRFESWPKIWDKAHDRPWFGHGVGQSAPYVYSIWAPMDKPHNEFLKMLFDTGYFGATAFVIALLAVWLNLTWIVWRAPPGTNWIASAAYMCWVGFILLSLVDNPLVCGNNFLHPTFAFVGAANAIAANQDARHRPEPSASEAAPRTKSSHRVPDLIPLR